MFTVYVDELIARLQASGLGCNIGRSYIGVLGYADDLTLLSPSVNALSKMVGICEEYAKEYDIVFNCKNTVGIQFGNRCNNWVIKLNGNAIKWQRSVKKKKEEEEEETLFDPKSTNVQITIPHISDIQFKQLCTHIYRHYVHKHSS